jgi:hypothetical protein
MGLIERRRPSPWMLVAVAALTFAIAGTALAGTGAVSKLTKSSVKKIANNQINKAAPGLSVAKAVSAENAASATNATNADNSATTGGQSVTKIFGKVAVDAPQVTLYQKNGLTLTLSCPGGVNTLRAATSVDNSIIASQGAIGATAFGTFFSDFDTGASFNPIGGVSRGAGTITYSSPTGSYVTVTFAADNPTTFGNFVGCAVVGSAISG